MAQSGTTAASSVISSFGLVPKPEFGNEGVVLIDAFVLFVCFVVNQLVESSFTGGPDSHRGGEADRG